MRPDPSDDRDMIELGLLTGGDPADVALGALVDELARVGAAARRNSGPRPGLAFGRGLREQLLATYPTSVASTAAGRAVPVGRHVTFVPGVVDRTVVRSRTGIRAGARVPLTRWTSIGLAAAVVVSVLGLNVDRLWSVPATIRAGGAVAAILVRDGQVQTLAPGAELYVGDVVRVGPDGHATLHLEASVARLAGGAEVAIEAATATTIALDQRAGRAYHRVVVPADGSYSVATAGITWTATGTAFDIDRSPTAAGERIRGLAAEHSVTASGHGLALTVPEGRTLTIDLPAMAEVSTGRVGSTDLADPWLIANARLDAVAGHPLGALAAIVTDSAIARPSAIAVAPVEPSASPSADPSTAVAVVSPSAPAVAESTPTAKPTPTPRPRPTPTPTPKPGPTPTPTPSLPSLSLTVTACHGGVLIDWSKYTGDGFNHYTTLRNSSSTIPKAYPPQEGAVDFGTSYTTQVGKTDAYDASVDGGSTYYYRAMAFDGEDRVIAASAVKSVTAKGVKPLGELAVGGSAGAVTLDWTPYGGPGSCFSWYKIAWSKTNPEPSYLEGDGYLAAIEDQGAGSFTDVDTLVSGETYHIRVQALRSTSTGTFLVAETGAATYTVP
jgi:hypothetical protein